jgi:hypothetical protein
MSDTPWYRRKLDRPTRFTIVGLCMTSVIIGWVTTNFVALAVAGVLVIVAALVFVRAMRQPAG